MKYNQLLLLSFLVALAACSSPKQFIEVGEEGFNPILEGLYADPEILYAEQTDTYYIYPTSDGFKNWTGDSFKVFSSKDLKTWKDEGVIFDLKKDAPWAGRNAWEPCIIEKKDKEKGDYNYYYYYTGAGKIGVATGKHPTGPFVDLGEALIDWKPEGIGHGAEIDPDVFTDPKTGKSYLYWGNGYMAVCELNEDMVSLKRDSMKLLITNNRYYSEGAYVFYRDGFYYFKHPDGIELGRDAGYNREVCIDRLEFNEDGSIKTVIPTI